MSPLPQTVTAFLGAAVLGVVSAAALYVVEHYHQEKRRHAMAQDLARLDSELSIVRRELSKLMQQQSDRNSKVKNIRKSKKANSVITCTSSEFMSSCELDSSDLEFYDVSDDETKHSISSALEERIPFVLPRMHFQQPINLSYTKPSILKNFWLSKTLKDIDEKLNAGIHLEVCCEKLEELSLEYPENEQILWRIGKCHKKIVDKLKNEKEIREHIEKGVVACEACIKLNSQQAEGHKWLAILIGARSDLQPIKERIKDGQLFKHHVDIAISIDPNDAALRHMVGRFCYEVASLKWYERKVAATLYSEPPKATFEEALEHFLAADKLASYEWKENELCAAKCYISLGKYKEALEWLDKANSVKEGDTLDEKVDKEVKSLLAKYSSYR